MCTHPGLDTLEVSLMNMNNNAALLLLLAVGVLTYKPPQPEFREALQDAAIACKDWVGASKNDVDNALNDGHAETCTQQCLQYCINSQAGFQDETEFNLEAGFEVYRTILVNHPEQVEPVEAIIRKCVVEGKAKGGNDPCKIAGYAQECCRQA